MTTAITLCASLRKGSYNEVLRTYVSKRLRDAGVEVNDIDLADYPLPIFGEEVEARGTPEGVESLARQLGAADIVFVASPEYNGGINPLINNTIAWLSRQKHNQFKHAVFGFGSVSSGKYGGVVSIHHLRDMFLKAGALVAPTLLGVGPASQAFEEDGTPKEPPIIAKVDQLVRELTHFSRGGA